MSRRTVADYIVTHEKLWALLNMEVRDESDRILVATLIDRIVEEWEATKKMVQWGHKYGSGIFDEQGRHASSCK